MRKMSLDSDSTSHSILFPSLPLGTAVNGLWYYKTSTQFFKFDTHPLMFSE